MNVPGRICIDSSEVSTVMRRRKTLYGACAAVGMMILILDSKTAFTAAKSGIALCLVTVIPALFPFIFLSILLSDSLLGERISILRPLGKLLKMPEGTESLLLCAFLGGYPSGAIAISNAFHAGSLSRHEAERLLSFCNNAGPAFIFGMGMSVFADSRIPWILWGIHILSAVIAGILIPGPQNSSAELTRKSKSPAITAAVSAMASVCAWVILFRVIIGFLDRWLLWLLPTEAKVAAVGFLELSNGFCALALVKDVRVRLILCSTMIALGGLCVTMQTITVTKGLRLTKYYLGKMTQFFISLLLSAAVAYGFWWLLPLSAVIIYCFSGIIKKYCRNSVPVHV